MKRFGIILGLALLISACGSPTPGAPKTEPAILTSTTFLADITRNVAGDRLVIESILPAGLDPHSYQPSPQDMARIEKSRLLIINGLGYEQFLQPLLDAQRAGL